MNNNPQNESLPIQTEELSVPAAPAAAPVVDSTQGLEQTPRPVSASIWQRIAYYSLFAAVVAAPVWFAIGRSLLGAGGWMLLITIAGAVIIILPYHIVLMVLAIAGKKAYLSVYTSITLFVYYVASIGFQLSLIDGGDTPESVGSVLTFAGLSRSINDPVSTISWLLLLASGVTLLALLIVDIVRRRKERFIER